MKTLEDILKAGRKKDLGEQRQVLEEFIDAEKRATDDRADRFVSAIEGIERIANILSDAVGDLNKPSEQILDTLKSHEKILQAISDKKYPEHPEYPSSMEVTVKNHPDPVREMSLKKPSWWRFQSNSRIESLIAGLREDLGRNISQHEDDEVKSVSGSPAVGSSSVIRRKYYRRKIYGEVPTGAINSLNKTFTLLKIPTPSTSLKLYLNGLRQKIGAANDYTMNGNTITYNSAPTVASPGLLADYDV